MILWHDLILWVYAKHPGVKRGLDWVLENEPGMVVIGWGLGLSAGQKGSTLLGMLSETGRVLAGTQFLYYGQGWL